MVSLVMYEPDMPQNVGAAMRLTACLGVKMHIIEPCGFVWDEKRVRSVAMDYIDHVQLTRHNSWAQFQENRQGRLVLLSTKGAVPYTDFQFQPDDMLMLGRESAGVPENVHEMADARLLIPMQGGLRSLNVVISGAMVLGEALRQLAK